MVNAQKLPHLLTALLGCMPLSSAANVGSAGSQPLMQKEAVEHIRTLIKADRLLEASREIASQLQAQRSDPELQFLKCVVQANQKQVPQAIGCFTELVKARPDMVEAYNNLGVLHASQGRHEEAKQWFDNGLRRVPALWTVHQNILNLQADLARKAYARALQIEVPVVEPQAKLSFLAATSSVVLASAAPQESNVANAPGTKSPMQAPSPVPVASAPVKTAPEVKTMVSASNAPKPKLDENQSLVQQALKTWAKAWSDKNLPAYFGAYSSAFTPGKGVSHASWQAERTARIAGRQFIRVAVSNVTFEVKNEGIAARFTQSYESDNLVNSNRKRLDFVLENGHWRIVRETVIGNTP